MELVTGDSSGMDRKRKRGEVRGIRCHHMLPCPTPMTGPDLLNPLERFSFPTSNVASYNSIHSYEKMLLRRFWSPPFSAGRGPPILLPRH
jgi:hypothetical protein